jgi:hypothetical protein
MHSLEVPFLTPTGIFIGEDVDVTKAKRQVSHQRGTQVVWKRAANVCHQRTIFIPQLQLIAKK